MNEILTVNFFLRVSPEWENIFIKASLDIRTQFPLEYYVDGINFYPHISLFSSNIPRDNLEQFVEIASGIANSIKPFSISTTDLFCSKSGVVMLDIATNQDIVDLHKEALEQLNPVRESIVNEKYQNEEFLRTLSEQDKEYVQKFGNVWVLENYKPHITFARLKNAEDFEKVKDYIGETLSRKNIPIGSVNVANEIFGKNGKSDIIFKKSL
jgi:2'-5' RNA ligase